MNNPSIGFIGAGNMAGSLIKGLLAKGFGRDSIAASDIDTEKLQQLQRDSGIRTASNQELADSADILVLAVKPQVLKAVCEGFSLGTNRPLVVSVAAGVTLDNLAAWLGNDVAIVRSMPNTPALIGKGATGLYANAHASEQHREIATELMNAVGLSVWVDSESEIDAVTAVSGSGPAYYFLFMEAMQEAALELGLAPEAARTLCQQTAIGACELAKSSADDVAELRRKVTSPGGTTEQAILKFESGGLRQLVKESLQAARDRSEELAKE